jgi:hypothetical protein
MPSPWSFRRSLRRRRVRALVATALVALGAAAIAPAQAASLFTDGFESGTMSAWSTVTAAAGGVVGVQSGTVHGGTKAAQLSETSASGSLAYARTQLTGDQNDLTATGAFMVTTEGAANANVPIFRFLDATGARAISLYRQNQSGNHIWVKVGNGSGALTTGLLPLSTWGVLSLHTIVAGTASTVSVSLNGTNIYTTTTATLSSPMRTVQVGNDTAAQTFGIFVDDVQLDSSGTSGDTTAPETTITTGPSGTVTTSSASFTFTSSEAGSTFGCSLDGAPYTSCTSPASYTNLTNASHTFAVRATDPAGNTDGSAASSTWTVNAPDTTPPDTTILSGPTGTVATADASFTFSSSEPGSTFECNVDGAPFTGCTSPASYTGLSNASHIFSVRATDAAGNVDQSPATGNWTVNVPPGDTTPPDTTITSGPSGTVTTASASFAFTSTETGSTFECSLDNAAFSACTSPATYSNLQNASHSFSVRATDAAKNTDPSPALANWVVNVPPPDTTPPDTAITGGPTGTVNTSNASFTFTSTEAASTFACSLDGGTFLDCTSPQVYSSLVNGPHSFAVAATDAAGNLDKSPATSNWTVNVVPGDTTPPDTSITSGPTGTVATASASFTFTSTEPGSTFACSIDAGAFATCTSPASYSGLANSSHTFSVRATDAAGNTDQTPAAQTWTVNVPPAAPVNTVLPSISGATSQGSMLTADLGTWTNSPTTYKYQWRRCNTSGAGCNDILNAFGTGYLTTSNDVGSTLRVVVTASNAGGPGTATSPATATIAAAAADPVIAAAGDIACDPHDSSFNGGSGTGSTCHQKATGALLGSLGNLSAILPLGDIQYDCGPVNEYAQSFGLAWGAYKSLLRPAPGNHEYRVNPDAFGLNDCSTTGAGYFGYFGASAGDPSKGYYSYDIGTWHLISLNANCTFIPCKANSAQELWLRSDLAAHSNMCTLAYYHQSRFSSGGSGNLSAYGPWWTDLYNGGADVVLSAHDHDYERFAPQNPSQVSDPARGIREFVVGTGGRSRSGFQTIMPNSEVRDSSAYGVLVLTLHPSSYDFRFVPEAGKTFTDSGSGTCHA